MRLLTRLLLSHAAPVLVVTLAFSLVLVAVVRIRTVLTTLSTTELLTLRDEGTVHRAAWELDVQLRRAESACAQGEGASQVATDGGTTLLLSQRSPDPAREVAFFYREAMRVLAGGKELAEIGGADDGSTTLVLGDPAARRAVQVRVSAEGTGSRIQIVSTLAASP